MNSRLLSVRIARPMLFLLLFVLLWTFLGFFFGLRSALVATYSGSAATPWSVAIEMSLLEWWGWGVFALLVILVHRSRLVQSRRRSWLMLLHLPLSLVLANVKMILDMALFIGVFGFLDRGYFGTPIERLFANFVTYWTILGAMWGISYYQKFRERQLRATQLEAKLLDARLNALKMQLHPHFLFNTLHAVSTLMHRDVDAAERMLARLGELLRVTIDFAEVNEVTLDEELQFLNRYLDIEAIRFGDRLQVERRIAPDTLDAAIPSFILQPLVENALRHGIEKSSEPGWIRIRSEIKEGRLRVEIQNRGPLLPDTFENLKQGIGIANTIARLEQLHGGKFRFNVRNLDESNVVAELEIPFRRL